MVLLNGKLVREALENIGYMADVLSGKVRDAIFRNYRLACLRTS